MSRPATSPTKTNNTKTPHRQRYGHRKDGVYVGDEALKAFPQDRYSMDVYYDKEDKAFVYTDGVNKFIVRPSQTPKKHKEVGNVSYYITGIKLKTGNTEFTMKKYIAIRKNK